ncbi:Hypothetical_protein [Hexamita inflata]|uniref:Hypothetical_protein n=1 Tax=Hexamita inflata TaxID=28002 RepID=A0AA86TXK9_9EUKA|nr:Hypothetical protein HINF_LOCUS19801 [Hexamita inflata]
MGCGSSLEDSAYNQNTLTHTDSSSHIQQINKNVSQNLSEHTKKVIKAQKVDQLVAQIDNQYSLTAIKQVKKDPNKSETLSISQSKSMLVQQQSKENSNIELKDFKSPSQAYQSQLPNVSKINNDSQNISQLQNQSKQVSSSFINNQSQDIQIQKQVKSPEIVKPEQIQQLNKNISLQKSEQKSDIDQIKRVEQQQQPKTKNDHAQQALAFIQNREKADKKAVENTKQGIRKTRYCTYYDAFPILEKSQ